MHDGMQHVFTSKHTKNQLSFPAENTVGYDKRTVPKQSMWICIVLQTWWDFQLSFHFLSELYETCSHKMRDKSQNLISKL